MGPPYHSGHPQRGYQDVPVKSGRDRGGNDEYHRPSEREREWQNSRFQPQRGRVSSPRRDGGCDQDYYGDDHHRVNGAEHHQRPDWKCFECHSWNYPDEGRCHRCGAYAEDMYPPPNENGEDQPNRKVSNRSRRSRHRNDYTEEGAELNGHAKEVDEFGRSKKRVKKEQKAEWPPCFETHGADYVLDARSGMFYQSTADFFYDPQTKLYYGNKQAAYFRYDKDHKPVPFVEVQKMDPSAALSSANDGNAPDAVLAPVASSGKGGKSGISINLKTTKLPKGSKKKAPPTSKGNTKEGTPNDSNPLQRQHQVDISKWAERQEEKKAEEKKQVGPSAGSSSSKICRTAKGEPICTLCQRKFPTIEKLRYHERVSKLHAENLKKKQDQQERPAQAAKEEKDVGQQPQQQQYVDRAQQRRDLHGSQDTTSSAALAVASGGAKTGGVTTEVVRPEETLGDANVGNQMLQKLGWKTGQSIGRRQQEGNADLKRDWERIEAMASEGVSTTAQPK